MPQEKRLPASTRKLRKAREKGDVAKSNELSAAVILTFGFAYLFLRSRSITKLSIFVGKTFASGADFQTNNVLLSSTEALGLVAELVVPFLAVLGFAAFAVETAQVGITLSFKPVAFNFGRLGFFQGIKRIFGTPAEGSRSALPLELLKRVLYLALLTCAFLAVLLFRGKHIISWSYQNPEQVLEVVILTAGQLLLLSSSVLLLLGSGDLLIQRAGRRKRLRMDPEEFRRETRESEGDPQTRGTRRQLHQELLLHGLAQDVRRAKVVVVGQVKG
jgi:type III secretion protein U